MPRDVKVSTAKLGKYAEKYIVPIVAETLWEDALHLVAEYACGDDKLDDPRDFIDSYMDYDSPGAVKDARQIVRVVQERYDMPIEKVMDVVGADDQGLFAYYLAMQSLGHGVAWTDDHDTTLKTPEDWDGSMWYCYEDAEQALDEYLGG